MCVHCVSVCVNAVPLPAGRVGREGRDGGGVCGRGRSGAGRGGPGGGLGCLQQALLARGGGRVLHRLGAMEGPPPPAPRRADAARTA